MTAAAPEDRPRARRWRERAFLQPLVVTIVGVAALPAVILGWSFLVGPPGDASSSCTGECGTARLANAFITGIAVLLVWCAVMVIAGFVVGRSSRDSGLGFRAVLVAVGSLALTAGIVYTLVSTTSEALLDLVFIVVGLAVAPLIPVSLGFVVGRSTKKTPPSTEAPGA